MNTKLDINIYVTLNKEQEKKKKLLPDNTSEWVHFLYNL